MAALGLIQSGACWQASTGNWMVKSQSNARLTYVTGIKHGAVFCSCKDFELHGRPCKHSLAALAPVAVAFILQCRWLTEPEELEIVADVYAERLRELPEVFRAIARAEYKAAYERLNASAALAA